MVRTAPHGLTQIFRDPQTHVQADQVGSVKRAGGVAAADAGVVISQPGRGLPAEQVALSLIHHPRERRRHQVQLNVLPFPVTCH